MRKDRGIAKHFMEKASDKTKSGGGGGGGGWGLCQDYWEFDGVGMLFNVGFFFLTISRSLALICLSKKKKKKKKRTTRELSFASTFGL